MDKFFEAVENGDYRRVAEMLQADSSLANATDPRPGKWGVSGRPALLVAAQSRQTEVARALIAAGANVNAIHQAMTPLNCAVETLQWPGFFGIGRLLIRSGADVSACGENSSALYLAIRGRSP